MSRHHSPQTLINYHSPLTAHRLRFLIIQECSQAFERSQLPQFDCAGCDAEDLGDLMGRQLLQEAQHEDLAIALIQLF
jgi:hypothetical protein